MNMIVRLLAGLTLWAAAFSLIYAMEGAACALEWHQLSFGPLNAARTLLVGLWMLSLLALAYLSWSFWPRARMGGTLDRVAFGAALAGLAAAAYTGMPTATLSLCL